MPCPAVAPGPKLQPSKNTARSERQTNARSKGSRCVSKGPQFVSFRSHAPAKAPDPSWQWQLVAAHLPATSPGTPHPQRRHQPATRSRRAAWRLCRHCPANPRVEERDRTKDPGGGCRCDPSPAVGGAGLRLHRATTAGEPLRRPSRSCGTAACQRRPLPPSSIAPASLSPDFRHLEGLPHNIQVVVAAHVLLGSPQVVLQLHPSVILKGSQALIHRSPVQSRSKWESPKTTTQRNSRSPQKSTPLVSTCCLQSMHPQLQKRVEPYDLTRCHRVVGSSLAVVPPRPLHSLPSPALTK